MFWGQIAAYPTGDSAAKVGVLQTKGLVALGANGRLAISLATEEDLKHATNDLTAYLGVPLTVFHMTRTHS